MVYKCLKYKKVPDLIIFTMILDDLVLELFRAVSKWSDIFPNSTQTCTDGSVWAVFLNREEMEFMMDKIINLFFPPPPACV